MYLLLDECCGTSLARWAGQLGHTAQRTMEVAELGCQASDDAIFALAARNGAVLVTVNRGDFIAIAGRGVDHAGVILVPSVPLAEMRHLLKVILVAAEPLIARYPNLFVEIDRGGHGFHFAVKLIPIARH